ncbi:MAG: cell division protein FtsL [Aquabacterium sp.]|nr:cell division protein FtsL [Aquabacterium sp.]
MLRFNLLLALVLLLSCFWLIRSSHESRHLFFELEKAQTQSHELQIDDERLQLDKRAQSASLRVEKLARDKLGMSRNTKDITQYVMSSASAVVAPAVPAGVQP